MGDSSKFIVCEAFLIDGKSFNFYQFKLKRNEIEDKIIKLETTELMMMLTILISIFVFSAIDGAAYAKKNYKSSLIVVAVI